MTLEVRGQGQGQTALKWKSAHNVNRTLASDFEPTATPSLCNDLGGQWSMSRSNSSKIGTLTLTRY